MNMVQKKKLYACILIAALVGCYGIEPGATTATMKVSSTDNVVTVTIPAGTVLYSDIGKTVPAIGTPAAGVYNLKFISQGGTVPGSASSYKLHETINPLAVYAQLSTDTSKASDGSGVFFDIEITVDSIPVKSITGNIRANIKLPTGYAAPGKSVYYYSYSKGVVWTKEGRATVKADGSVDITTNNLSLAVTKFSDWVPPGNGKLPQGTYPVSGSPFGQFTFVIGASPIYTVSAKTELGVVIPVTTGSIALQSGSTTLYDFTAELIYNSNIYIFTGTLDKVSGKIAGTYSGSSSGSWNAIATFKSLISDAMEIAGTDNTLNQLLRIQTETSGGYMLPLAIADNTIVEPAKAFDNAYYLGYKGTGSWVITNTLGDIYLIDSLNNASDAQNIIVPGMQELGLDPAKLKGVLVTHGHGDHYGGAKYLQDTYGVKVYMGQVDKDYMIYGRTPAQLALMPTVTDFYTNSEDLDLGGGLIVTTIFTPGHTPGGFSFIFPVYDNGTKHMAAVWGGSGTAVPDYQGAPGSQPVDAVIPGRNKVQYAQSVDKFSTYTKAANVEVIIGVHGFMDNNLYKLEVLRYPKPFQVNPFIIGYDIFSRYEQILKITCLAYLAENI